MSISDLKISTKLNLLSAVLAGAIFIMAAGGIIGLQMVDQAAQKIEVSAHEIKEAERLEIDSLELNRTEYHLTANPEFISKAKAQIEGSHQHFLSTLKTLNDLSSEEEKVLLREIRSNFEAYANSVQRTISIAAEKNYEISADQRQIVKSIEVTEPALNALNSAIDTYVDAVNKKAEATAKSAHATTTFVEILLIVLAVISIVIGFATALYLARHQIAIPLAKVVESLRRVSGNDLDVEIDQSGRKDEIGDLNVALGIFVTNTRKQLEMIHQQELDAEEKMKRANHVKELTHQFELSVAEAISSLSSAATEMQATAAHMSENAVETERQSGSVSAVSTQTSANVQTIAAASEELSTTSTDVARQMCESANMASSASSRTEAAITNLQGLETAAMEIDEVVGLITAIAAQTKLLALNATIEAVRAGEAGKGFNVVASEVKALAEQTEQATARVTAQIQQVKGATKGVLDSVDEITRVVGTVSELTTSVAATAEEQVATIHEINRSVQEAATGTVQVGESVAALELVSQQTASSSSQVAMTASDLAKQSHFIKSTIDGYLRAIEAA